MTSLWFLFLNQIMSNPREYGSYNALSIQNPGDLWMMPSMYGLEQMDSLKQSACCCGGSSVVDVCDLCKTDERQLSPDSVISYSEVCDGCRTEPDAKGADVDIVDKTNASGVNGSNGVNASVADVNPESFSLGPRKPPITDSKIFNDLRKRNEEQRKREEEARKKLFPKVPTNPFDKLKHKESYDGQATGTDNASDNGGYECPCKRKFQTILDKEGFQKMCDGRMTGIEYALNITIIIIFLALSVMAFQLIFNIAARNAKCKACRCVSPSYSSSLVNGGLSIDQTNKRTELPKILLPSAASKPLPVLATPSAPVLTGGSNAVSLTGSIF